MFPEPLRPTTQTDCMACSSWKVEATETITVAMFRIWNSSFEKLYNMSFHRYIDIWVNDYEGQDKGRIQNHHTTIALEGWHRAYMRFWVLRWGAGAGLFCYAHTVFFLYLYHFQSWICSPGHEGFLPLNTPFPFFSVWLIFMYLLRHGFLGIY